ncbi:MAG TPA: MFS transporter [Bradyrhizobium sp.]|nr:MFS transporter [Bradyrhizobium sp.]
MTNMASDVNLTALIDNQRIGGFHIRVLFLCGACCFISGFYTVALGFTAPIASVAMSLPAGALGPAFMAMGFGVISGSLVCTPLADRIGRKPVIIGGLLMATPFLLLMQTAASVLGVMWRLYFAGFGLMGSVPIVLALAGEFMPTHSRVTMTMLVWIGFNIGSMVAGVLAASLAFSNDWRALFLVNGTLALTVAIITAVWLPESLDYLCETHASDNKIKGILRRLCPKADFANGARFTLAEKDETGFPVSLLFRKRRAQLTLLLWLMFFANIAALVFLNSWLATLLVRMGIAKNYAIIIAASTNAGGIIGGIIVSELCDHYEDFRFYILGPAFVLGGLCIAALAYPGGAVPAFVTAAMAGFFTYGTQNTANAIAATIYPTAMRSTGAGWAIGIGNSAQIASPLVGGLLLSLNWSTEMILFVAALPTLVAGLTVIRLGCIAHRGKAADIAL